MKLPKLRAEIRRVEAELRRMYQHARNLEISVTMPHPLVSHYDLSDEARARAMVLFWRHLTPEQRGEYKRQHWFTAIGNETGEKYRISRVRAAREQVVGGLLFVRFFCLVIPHEITPSEDIMLAKKIIIEKDERLFLYTAIEQSLTKADQFDVIINRDR